LNVIELQITNYYVKTFSYKLQPNVMYIPGSLFWR